MGPSKHRLAAVIVVIDDLPLHYVPGTRQQLRNLLVWLRIADYCEGNVEHRLLLKAVIYGVGFRVAFLAEHKCLAVNL